MTRNSYSSPHQSQFSSLKSRIASPHRLRLRSRFNLVSIAFTHRFYSVQSRLTICDCDSCLSTLQSRLTLCDCDSLSYIVLPSFLSFLSQSPCVILRLPSLYHTQKLQYPVNPTNRNSIAISVALKVLQSHPLRFGVILF